MALHGTFRPIVAPTTPPRVLRRKGSAQRSSSSKSRLASPSMQAWDHEAEFDRVTKSSSLLSLDHDMASASGSYFPNGNGDPEPPARFQPSPQQSYRASQQAPPPRHSYQPPLRQSSGTPPAQGNRGMSYEESRRASQMPSQDNYARQGAPSSGQDGERYQSSGQQGQPSRSFSSSPLAVVRPAAPATNGGGQPSRDGYRDGGRDEPARSSTMTRPGSTSTVRASLLPANEGLHDMDRAVSLLKGSKFYAEGFLMKKVEVGADGKAVRRLSSGKGMC